MMSSLLIYQKKDNLKKTDALSVDGDLWNQVITVGLAKILALRDHFGIVKASYDSPPSPQRSGFAQPNLQALNLCLCITSKVK